MIKQISVVLIFILSVAAVLLFGGYGIAKLTVSLGLPDYSPFILGVVFVILAGLCVVGGMMRFEI